MGSKPEHIHTNRRREPWRAWSLLVPLLVLLASDASGTPPSHQAAAFTIRMPKQMTSERLLLLARGMSRFRLGPRSPDGMNRMWKDLRTGQEIGGEAKDLLRPLGDKTGPSAGGGGDKEGGGPLGVLRRALKKRSVRLVALVTLLAGGGMAVQDRRNVRSPEPFIRQAVDRRIKADKAGRKAVVPVAPPQPEDNAKQQPQVPVPPSSARDGTGEREGDRGAERAEKSSEAVPLPPPVGKDGGEKEVVPAPVPPPLASEAAPLLPSPSSPEAPGNKGTQQNGERKRWTPFRDMRRRAAAAAGQRGREEMKDKAAREGDKAKEEESLSKEERQEGLEEARILGQDKDLENEKEKEKAPEQAKPEEQGDKTVQPTAPLDERERETPQSPDDEGLRERVPEGEGQENEEEDESVEGGGIKGGWIDRRGTVLLGTPQAPEASPPSVSGGEEVTIPEVGGLGGTTTRGGQRHGTSFVSSVFRTVGPAVPRVDCVKVYKGEIKFASGSGVIFTPEGHLITNSLLVRNALELKVTLADGREYPAIVKGMDEVLDVAVLKILSNSPPPGLNSGAPPAPPPTFQYAPIGDSDALQVGDWVMSIGSQKSPGPSVILGVVSGLTRTAAEVGRPETQVNFIQTDASFDANVVGGPLVNEFGEVVGITSIGMTTSDRVQFSVPINQIKGVVTDLANGKVVQHASIGVEMMPITPSLAAQLNNQMAKEGSQIVYIPEGGAVVVVNVLEDSPAMEGGLKTLDILLEIERRPIYKVEDAQRIIQSAGVGQDLEIKVLRQSQEVTLRVRTGDFLKLIRKAQSSHPSARKPRRGIPRDDGADRRSTTPSTPTTPHKPLTPPSQQHHEQQQASPRESERGDGPTTRRGPSDESSPPEPQSEGEGSVDTHEPLSKGYLYV